MKKIRFTWIDGVLIAVLAALLIGTFVKFFAKDPAMKLEQTVSLTYTLSSKALRPGAVEALQVGDTVYETAGKGYLGTISKVDAVPATAWITGEDGTLRQITLEDRYDVTLTVTAQGYDNGDHYQIGTYTIRVNRPSACFTKYVAWDARVLSLG